MPVILDSDDAGRRWVDIGNGAAVLCRRAETPIVYTARAEAEQLAMELASGAEAITRAGGHITGLPDLTSEAGMKGSRNALFAVCLVERVADDWRNVQDANGEAVAFKPALIASLLINPGIADRLLDNLLARFSEMEREANF